VILQLPSSRSTMTKNLEIHPTRVHEEARIEHLEVSSRARISSRSVVVVVLAVALAVAVAAVVVLVVAVAVAVAAAVVVVAQRRFI